MKVSRRNILSIDGGGIRGIIPICALAELEKRGKRSGEVFSFVAGTSTGAIIAAAIAAGVPAEDILTSYRNLAGHVFAKDLLTIPRRVVRGHMYSTVKLRDAVATQLGAKSTWKLNDSGMGLLISAKGLADGHAWYFVRDNPRNAGKIGHLRLVDCVTGSAAAPTFFEPWSIPDPVGAVVDGGVGVTGNPVYQACVEAFIYSDGYTPDATRVVSLGTGRFPPKARPKWLWQWLQWVLGELMQSPGEQQTALVQRHYPSVEHYRIDPDMTNRLRGPKIDISLDDVGSISELERIGRAFAQTIEWEGILNGTTKQFRIGPDNTDPDQYKA